MVNGIGSSASSSAGVDMQLAAIHRLKGAARSTAQAAPPIADTVKLSPTAQAHALQQQGMAVKSIAANMGITTQAVDSYLGISSTVTGGGGDGTATLKNIAAHVRVIGPESSSKS